MLLGLTATALGTGGFLLFARGQSLVVALVALVLALLGYAAVLRAAWSGAGSRRAVVATSAVLLAVAVAVPPWPSRDLYLYAMQGRIVATHHDSPYVHPPSDYPDDPWLGRVARPYRESRSYYGPAFVAVSAAGMAVAGASELAGRLFFQGLAAAAVLAVMALLARRDDHAGALAFFGLHPVLLVRGVNEGHVDVLLGLVVVVAVLLLRRRPLAAGVVLGVAALVKVIALLPLAAAVAWAWRRRGRRAGVRAAAGGAATVAAGYLLAGGVAALAPLRGAGDDVSRASIWRPLHGGLADEVAGVFDARAVAALALVTVVVLAAVVVATWWRDDTAERPVAGALAAYLLAGTYVLSWYPAGALAALGLRWRSGLALLVSAHAGLLGVAYVRSSGGSAPTVTAALGVYGRWVVPAFELAAVAGLILLAVHRARTGRRLGPPVPAGTLSGGG